METLEGQALCVGLRNQTGWKPWEIRELNASLFDGKIMENYVYIYIIYIYRELSIDVLILIENQPCINLHLFRSRISQPRLMTPEAQFENDHLGLSTSLPERLFEVSWNGVPQQLNGLYWKNMNKNPTKMDDLGVPPWLRNPPYSYKSIQIHV